MGAGGTGARKRAADRKTVAVALIAAGLFAANIVLWLSIIERATQLAGVR